MLRSSAEIDKNLCHRRLESLYSKADFYVRGSGTIPTTFSNCVEVVEGDSVDLTV